MVVCYGPLSAQLEEYLSDIGLIAVKYKCLIFFKVISYSTSIK